MGTELNVVYLKTAQARDFYLFSHNSDEGFRPYAEMLVQGDRSYLVITSKFKLKKIEKKPINRLDVYLSPENAAVLSNEIEKSLGYAKPRQASGDPELSRRKGGMQLPAILQQSEVKCYGLVSSAGGRSMAFRDPEGKTRVFVDLESAKQSHKAMTGYETHIGILFGRGNIPVALSNSYQEEQKVRSSLHDSEIREIRKLGLDPEVFGWAYGSILVKFDTCQTKEFGAALRITHDEFERHTAR